MIGENVTMPVALAPRDSPACSMPTADPRGPRRREVRSRSRFHHEHLFHRGRGRSTSRPFWFQPLRHEGTRASLERLINRAKAAKCSALVITLDLQILGQRHRDIKNGLSSPPKATLRNLINLATKPYWCWHMLQTKRRTKTVGQRCQRLSRYGGLLKHPPPN